jgi:hypothetical protein
MISGKQCIKNKKRRSANRKNKNNQTKISELKNIKTELKDSTERFNNRLD